MRVKGSFFLERGRWVFAMSMRIVPRRKREISFGDFFLFLTEMCRRFFGMSFLKLYLHAYETRFRGVKILIFLSSLRNIFHSDVFQSIEVEALFNVLAHPERVI